MRTLNKRLYRMIIATKMQFVAVTMVLAIGIISFTALNLSMQNLDTTVREYYRMTNYADIFCEVMRIPSSKILELANISGVERVSGRVVRDVKVDTPDDKRSTIRLISYDTASASLNDVYLVDGRMIASDDEIMLVKMFADARGLTVGSRFKMIVGGKRRSMSVCGIVANPEYIYLIEDEQTLLPDPTSFGVGYVTKDFAQGQLGFDRAFNHVYFRANPGVDIDALIANIDKKMERYGVIRIHDRAEQMSARMVHEEIEQGKKSALAVPVIFISVAAFIIAIMISRIVKNDRMTIGVLKALGYSNRDILLHYACYALLIGFIGTLVGIVVGIFVANGFARLYTTTVFDIPILVGRVYPAYLVMAVLLSSSFCILAGLYGARGVLSIDPAESMRPEAPKQGKRIFLERLTALWRHVNFSWKMVIRNMFRSKQRLVFIVLGVALTYSITLTPLYMMEAFNTMFDKQYGEMYHMDYTISLTRAANKHIIDDLKGLTGANAIEPQVEFPFKISRGWKSRIVNIIGVPVDTSMYSFSMDGLPLAHLPSKGIILTEGLAKLLDVRLGQQVTVASFIPGRSDNQLVVTAIVKQQLGVNAYMSLDFMQAHLLESGFINSLVLRGDDIKPTVFDQMAQVKSVQSLAELKDVFKKFTALTLTSIGMMIVCAGILGFVIIYNATVMSINERGLEFSSMRVMGFSKRQIFGVVLRENIIMAVLGIALGVPIGAVMIDGMVASFSNELYTMEVIQNPLTYLHTAIIVIGFVIIAQLATYSKIHHLNFMDALKARTT